MKFSIAFFTTFCLQTAFGTNSMLRTGRRTVDSGPYCFPEFKAAIEKTTELVAIRTFEIQGRDRTSPYVGQLVYRVPGIVTAINGDRFIIQDLVGDGVHQTSDAVEVVTHLNNPRVWYPSLAVGDLFVANLGTVQEFIPPLGNTNANRLLSKTQIVLAHQADGKIVGSGYQLPDPVYLGQGGWMPPTKDMGAGVKFWSGLEAMRVVLPRPLAVTPTLPGGDFFAVGDLGHYATGLSERKTMTVNPDDFNPEKIKIHEDPGILDFAFPEVDAGDQLSNIQGIVEYTPASPLANPSDTSAAYYQITPTNGFYVAVATTNKPTESSCKLDDDTIAVATYNMDGVNLNDANQIQRTATIIVDAMKSPDVIALQGIPDSIGNTAATKLNALVQAIDNTGPTYTYVLTASGAFRNAILYRDDRVDLLPGSNIDISFPGNIQVPSLAAAFRFSTDKANKVFHVVNNDWVLKLNSSPSFGTLQPFEELQEDAIVNGMLSDRLIQSNTVRDFVAGKSNVIVLGDFNEYEFVSPVRNIEYLGFKNLVHDFHPNDRYSYIFEGNTVAFDQILVSKEFCPVSNGKYIRVNTDIGPSTPYHDPMVACIDITRH